MAMVEGLGKVLEGSGPRRLESSGKLAIRVTLKISRSLRKEI
jgi:hypothetical protein